MEFYIKTGIVCIAKYESDYIKSFVDYHLKIGFDEIYIYDNENEPTYEKLLNNPKVKVIHLPNNNYHKAVQYIVLEDFAKKYISSFTHITHIDIDEYIVLKKHSNIKDFIREYIIGDCAGIGINWRFFGSNGHLEKTDTPDPIRFTRCELKGNIHIKTLFDVTYFEKFITPHSIKIKQDMFIKNTNNDIIYGPLNNNIDFSVIQLNHYKCKTLPEFKYIRTRGRADLCRNPKEDIIHSFELYNLNEIEELTILKYF